MSIMFGNFVNVLCLLMLSHINLSLPWWFLPKVVYNRGICQWWLSSFHHSFYVCWVECYYEEERLFFPCVFIQLLIYIGTDSGMFILCYDLESVQVPGAAVRADHSLGSLSKTRVFLTALEVRSLIRVSAGLAPSEASASGSQVVGEMSHQESRGCEGSQGPASLCDRARASTHPKQLGACPASCSSSSAAGEVKLVGLDCWQYINSKTM